MQYCIFEDNEVDHLQPLVATRGVFDLRVGRQTLLDRLCRVFDVSRPVLHVRRAVADVTAREHPEALVNEYADPGGPALFLNGRYLALDEDVIAAIKETASSRERGIVYMDDGTVVAALVPEARTVTLQGDSIDEAVFGDLRKRTAGAARFVSRLWHLVEILPEILIHDGRRFIERRGPHVDTGHVREKNVIVDTPEQIRCAETAVLKPGAVLNAENGPIIIDEQATVMEGAIVRGPLYAGPHSRIRPGARVEGSAFGPHSHVGGEIEHSTVHSYANKVHDGFLGSSYIGRWCNLAADTNTSTLKNDYSQVSLYNYRLDDFEQTGQQHLGLFMGDHSKCGINSMFNPGCVVGVFCNLFGSGYMPRHVPSFSWGSPGQLSPYRLEKAREVAAAAAARRGVELTDAEQELLRKIHAGVHGSA